MGKGWTVGGHRKPNLCPRLQIQSLVAHAAVHGDVSRFTQLFGAFASKIWDSVHEPAIQPGSGFVGRNYQGTKFVYHVPVTPATHPSLRDGAGLLLLDDSPT